MPSRRNCLQLAGLTLLLPTELLYASKPKSLWRTQALQGAQPCVRALCRHPFLTQVFAGTLSKERFVAYLCQNILYLANYAKCLAALENRLCALPGFAVHCQNLQTWAKETEALRRWSIEYASDLSGRTTDPAGIEPYAELLSYMNLESRAVRDPESAVSMAALLPCFAMWDAFGKALRPKAKIKDNPYRAWVEGMGSAQASQSALAAWQLADLLAARTTPSVRNRMTDVYLAGCWLEWQLFEAAYAKGGLMTRSA